MKIHVRFAGYFRTITDQSSIELELQEGATVDDARTKLDNITERRFHNMLQPYNARSNSPNCLFVVDTQIVETDTELRDGDVLAIVPPMAGG